MPHRVIFSPSRIAIPAVLALLAASGLLACYEIIPLEDAFAPDTGLPTDSGSPQTTPDGATDGSTTPAQPVGPVVQITLPGDGDSLTGDTFVVQGIANDDNGLASVVVQAGNNLPVEATSTDGFRTWQAQLPVGQGPFVIQAWGYDIGGRRTEEPDSILVNGPGATSDSDAPTVTITLPQDGSLALQPLVIVQGTAEDDSRVVSMEVYRNGELLTERPVETDNWYADWVRLVPLVPGEENLIEVVALDSRGQQGRAAITLTGSGIDDRNPPLLTVTSPAAGDILSDPTLIVLGSATDAVGVRTVEARVTRIGPDDERVAGDWETVAGTAAWRDFRWETEVFPGDSELQVRAIDVSGLTSVVTIPVTAAYEPEYGDDRLYTLRLRNTGSNEPLTVEVDSAGLAELLPEDVQRDIVMIELDPTILLRNTLDTIKNACGTLWREDNPNPRHDCSLTELGRSFRGPDGTWRSSPEYALVRLLTMTPANVRVAGTSIEGLQELADGSFFGIRIGGGFSQILADALGISRTTEIAGTLSTADSLRENLIATHPAATEDGFMPITLFDALRDLTPLGERFGPIGDHPGAVDNSVPPFGAVFGPDFRMLLRAASNLRWVDGVDLDSGKDYMSTIVDTTGPGFNDVIELDFTSEDNFQIFGLIERPTSDLRFRVLENDLFVPSCNGEASCQGNLPGSPTTPSSYWAQPSWQLETIVASAAFRQYRERRFRNCYINFIGCQADIRIGQGVFPAGWTEFDIILNLGNPPRDQYIWELITEVGQVALHTTATGTIAEGLADVAFNMKGIEVGITADELRTATRPYLQDQAPAISDLLLGDFRSNNGQLDFFYRLGANNEPYLFFVTEDDPRPVDTYDYARPGFFSSPDLTEESRLSARAIPGSGDTSHEKYAVPLGESVVWMQDEAGDVWRLRVQRDSANNDIVVRAARRLR